MSSPVCPTTFSQSANLSDLLRVNVIFADETKQSTGSFKFRAAYNVASNVPHQHIIAASSGNFAQALAYACSLLGKKCTIVMPSTAAQVKVDGVKKFGGRIEFVDTNKDSRAAKLEALANQYPEAYATNAYDNPLIIEGNQSLGREIKAFGHFDYIISPIGGGGLISGIILGAQDNSNVIGAEPAMANDAARSLRSGQLIANDTEPMTIADGARTISLGKHNWAILKERLKEIIEVPEGSIKEALKLIYNHLQIKCEPTGALALGAVLTELDRFKNKRVCCVISGGNVDEKVFRSIIPGSS